MKLTTEQYEDHCENLNGYCRHCDRITTEGVEPDAEGYDCPKCEKSDVMGVENALVLGHIEINETPSELDDNENLDIISFSDED